MSINKLVNSLNDQLCIEWKEFIVNTYTNNKNIEFDDYIDLFRRSYLYGGIGFYNNWIWCISNKTNKEFINEFTETLSNEIHLSQILDKCLQELENTNNHEPPSPSNLPIPKFCVKDQ